MQINKITNIGYNQSFNGYLPDLKANESVSDYIVEEYLDELNQPYRKRPLDQSTQILGHDVQSFSEIMDYAISQGYIPSQSFPEDDGLDLYI